jgi:hypothetical protein
VDCLFSWFFYGLAHGPEDATAAGTASARQRRIEKPIASRSIREMTRTVFAFFNGTGPDFCSLPLLQPLELSAGAMNQSSSNDSRLMNASAFDCPL